MSSLTNTDDNPTLEAAIELATKLYWPVFPVDITNGKHPLSSKAFNEKNWGQTTDRRDIEKHFTKWGNAAIGVATGEDSGIFVLDVDSPKGGHAHDGFATLAELEAKYGKLPETVVAETASGGKHYYFEYPDFKIKTVAGDLGKGIDTRGDRGMIVVPPSVRYDGETGGIVGAYEWLVSPFEADVAEAPAWLLDLLRPKPKGRPARPSALAIAAKPDGRVGKLLDQLRKAEEGSRNDTLNSVAFQIAQLVGDNEDVRSQLYDIAIEIGEEHGKALATINGAMARGAEHPKVETEFLSLTDGALADKIEAQWRNGKNGVRTTEADDWYFWQIDHWAPGGANRAKGLVENHLREFADQINEMAKITADQSTIADAHKAACDLMSAKKVANVYSLAKCRSSLIIDPGVFDQNIDLLGIPGGVIDLRTMERREARPDDYISRQTKVAPVKGEPTLWKAFLKSAFPENSEKVEFLKRVFGYALSGSCKEEKFFFFLGDGRNGKGVTIDTIAKVFGDYARTVDPRIFIETRGEHHPTTRADLAGPRLVTFNEIPKGKSWDEEFLKQVTGRDTVNARKMFKDSFDFKPRSTLVCGANDAPSLSADAAIRARLVLIEFLESFVGREDSGLKDRLFDEEGPQILNWCLEGLKEYQSFGLAIPESVKAASIKYADDNDIIKNFIDECCTDMSCDKVKWSPTKNIFSEFQKWMREQELKPWSMKTFSSALKKNGYIDQRSRDCRGFQNIKIDLSKRSI